MRKALSQVCFALASICLIFIYELPIGSPVVLAPLAIIALFAPLGAALWPQEIEPGPEPIPFALLRQIGTGTTFSPARPEPPAAAQKVGSVARYMAERLTRAEGQRVRIDDLREAYSSWCEASGLGALGADEFQERLKELCEAASIRLGKGRSILNVTLAQ